MARAKYWDDETKSWKYADDGMGGNSGDPPAITSKKVTLAEGSYSDGTIIPLSASLADFDLIEIHVKDTYGNTGVLHGKYTSGDYAGGGVTALGGVYSSGGYIYYATVNITASGRMYFPPMYSASVGSQVSWATASSGTRYVTRIVGYKFE
jgi:hypothetical protein